MKIAAALDGDADLVAALRRHHAQLLAEGARLARLAETVARPIDQLEHATIGGDLMTIKINRPENLFEGFDASASAAEAAERWPEEYEQSAGMGADGRRYPG